jgi:NADH-quinone oxidoreductase subunit N
VIQSTLTLISLVLALGTLAYVVAKGLAPLQTAGVAAEGAGVLGAVVLDKPALFLQATILLLSLLAALTMIDRGDSGGAFVAQASQVPGSHEEEQATRAGWVQTELQPLLLFSVGGMMLFPASNDLLTMFVALEVFSLPLYLMTGLARRRRLLSQEASLKYFLLGAFSSAFFLYGAALLYGFAGTVRLGGIADAISGVYKADGTTLLAPVIGRDSLLLAGVAMVAVGVLFKVGAVPFHSWTPDVYQGAPTPVTGFMAACTKISAFGALLRLLYVSFAQARWDYTPVLWTVAVATMLVGAVIAIVQTDIKRMLAYSSIAHAGFLLVGVLSFSTIGIQGVLFYLVVYGFTTIGAFGLVTLVRDKAADGSLGGEATHLSQWAGLGRRYPWLGATFSLFLLAFAGIPLTSGFIGKYAVFAAAVAHGAWPFALVGVLASAIAAFFYIRVIVLMYFSEPTSDDTVVMSPGSPTLFAIAVAAVVTVFAGVAPSFLLDLAGGSTLFLP